MSAKKISKKTTTKKAAAPVKEAAPKKSACSCAKSECKVATPRKKVTRVIAKFNAGWGNQLFIRGTGAGLDWNKGIPMQCMGDDEWLWEQLVPSGDVSFKILVNDSAWNVGDDFSVVSGETIICHPNF